MRLMLVEWLTGRAAVLQAGRGGRVGGESGAAAGGGGGGRRAGAPGAAAAGRPRGARRSPPVRASGPSEPQIQCELQGLTVLDHLQLHGQSAVCILFETRTASRAEICHSDQARSQLDKNVAHPCRLSQLTTATGSGESATQPPPSAVIEDGAPAVVSADTAWDDDSPILATGTGAAEEPAAATASLPETEAVSHQTDVQGLDDREDDSESR